MEQTLLLENGMTIGVIFILSYIISYVAIPIIIMAAKEKHLFDRPDQDRKLHLEAIPTLGGIAIFLAVLLSFSVSPWADSLEGYSYFVGALLILFFTGLKDDLVMLSAIKKLLAQLVAVGLIVFGSGMVIDNFHGALGFADIPYWGAVPVTFFAVIVVTNAVNLIDGIDGLAGGIGTLASLIFGAAFLYVGELPMAMFSFCVAGALLGFLYYNFSPASIFMGDTGSMLLGFLLSVQAIKFVGLGDVPAFSSAMGSSSAILVVAILGLPLFDTIRVVIRRLRRGSSIFKPGQDHVHHELLRMGFSHQEASLLLYAKSLLLVTFVGVLAWFKFNPNILLGAVLVSSLVIYPTNGFKRRVCSKIFGFDWLEFRTRKWGISIDDGKIVPLNAETKPDGKVSEEAPVLETEEKEYEGVAI